MGLVIGGAIMICVLAFQFTPGFSSASAQATPTSNAPVLPRLLAPETNLLPQPTRTRIAPTSTSKPVTASTPTGIEPTSTPFSLLHEQQPEVIGTSMEGRPLLVYTFGSGEHERMIVADVHGGDEWNTLTLANQLIKYLNASPDMIPDDITLYILPSLNPDGEARSHDKYGRLNANGVDLNRNFPVNWRANWERGGCWNYLPTSGGTGPGSEVETQALINFLSAHEIEALISYHSAALGIFPGGEPWDDESVRLAEGIAEVSTYHYPPLDFGCKYSGTLPDYAASLGIAAVDVELTNHFDSDFEMNLDILQVLLNREWTGQRAQ